MSTTERSTTTSSGLVFSTNTVEFIKSEGHRNQILRQSLFTFRRVMRDGEFGKTEKRFFLTTRYEDFPISRNLCHWESQSNTSNSNYRHGEHLPISNTTG